MRNTLRLIFAAATQPSLDLTLSRTVFYLIRPPDEWVVITVLREQLYAIEAAAEAEAAQTAAAEAAERGTRALALRINFLEERPGLSLQLRGLPL